MTADDKVALLQSTKANKRAQRTTEPAESTNLYLRTAADGRSAIPDSEIAVWIGFVAALAEGGDGCFYLAGTVSSRQAKKVQKALKEAAASIGSSISWGEKRTGSFWRKFKSTLSRKFDESDVDTMKRAAQVHLLDTAQSASALNLANAAKSLAEATRDFDHSYFFAQNLVLVKSKVDGESVAMCRVLTNTEILAFQSGDLQTVLNSPSTALEFVRSGLAGVELPPSSDGTGGDESPRPIEPN